MYYDNCNDYSYNNFYIYIDNKKVDIVKEIVYDTFGNIISDSNETLKIPFGFAGGLYDPDTKLIHFGFREYDPFIGRWTAKDPILFAGGDSNLYGYVLGDPVGGVDESGLKTKLDRLITNDMRKKVLNIDKNIRVFEKFRDLPLAKKLMLIYKFTHNGSLFDFKQIDPSFEDYGNFHYGAICAAIGIPDTIILRGAGWAQKRSGNSKPEFGNPWGFSPFGDDPKDQVMIEAGIIYYKKYYRNKK